MCGLCMEFGPNGALQVPFNQDISKTCDVSCENGKPDCRFHLNGEEGPQDRWKFKASVKVGSWKASIELAS